MVYKQNYYPPRTTTKKRTWLIYLYDTLNNSLKFGITPYTRRIEGDEFLVYYLINDEASKIYNKLESYIEVT